MIKPTVLSLALASLVAAAARAEGDPSRTTRAAKMKPDAPWRTFSTRLVADLPGYQSTTDGPKSPYGGILPPKFTGTGFFRTEKTGARWWLVDPQGCRYLNVGVVAVSPPPMSGPLRRQLPENLSTPRKWAETTIPYLRELGFNGAGAWSNEALVRGAPQPLVYTRIWNFMSSYGRKRGGIYQKAGHMGYPGDCIFVFDPEFAEFCDSHAKQLATTKNDPWLLGHFSDNELPFYRRTLDNFLRLPKDDHGRKAADAWLAKRRKSHPGEKGITDNARLDFLFHVADTYLRITTAAIRKYDPNHLCLGPRFTGHSLESRAIFEAAGRHLDAIAVNYYHAWSPDPTRTSDWIRWSGKPFIVTEWYAKGMDSGYANTSGAGWVVATQRDRGDFYQNFTIGLLESGNCVGWHWFKYRDNDPRDTKADPSNRDSNKGLVNLDLQPYQPLARSMRELNRQVYSLADYFDRRAR